MLKDKLTMLILSCDKYSDLWDAHIKLLNQNWPDCPIRVILVTDKQTDKKYENVSIFCAGEELEFSQRIGKALDFNQYRLCIAYA